MIYRRWMSYVRDDVKITNLVIPSAHNAGSYGMKPVACCQDGNFYEQFLYGIRHFCVRLDTDKKGNILLCHGIKKGDAFENALKDWQRMLEENDSEFFIFDVREYYTQHLIGNINLKFLTSNINPVFLKTFIAFVSSICYDIFRTFVLLL